LRRCADIEGITLAPERLVHTSPYRDRLQIISVKGFAPRVAISMVRGDAPTAFTHTLDIMRTR